MNDLPVVLAERCDAQHGEFDLRVDADCPWFQGHFTGQPILPGVVQIGWAAAFAERWKRDTAPARVLSRVKFKRPILPGAALRLRLEATGTDLHWEFLLRSPDGSDASASSGIFCDVANA